MDVSVIIPVGSDVAGLEITLDSIRAQAWDPDRIEVIVCNDGGGADVSKLAAAFGCREAQLEANRGSFAARNAGLALARGRVLGFLDADERLAPGWLKAGLEALREGADYVGGRILVDVDPASSYWKRVDLEYAFPVEYYLRRMRFAPTANLLVVRKVFETVGGFEEALRSGGDREFGVRVARHGFVQRYCATATTIHPPRGLREQLRKARRTARGAARLEVLAWQQPALRVASNCLWAMVLQLVNCTRFLALHFLRRGGPRHREIYLLTAGRLLVKAYSLACKAFSATLQPVSRRRFSSRVPLVPRLTALALEGHDAS